MAKITFENRADQSKIIKEADSSSAQWLFPFDFRKLSDLCSEDIGKIKLSLAEDLTQETRMTRWRKEFGPIAWYHSTKRCKYSGKGPKLNWIGFLHSWNKPGFFFWSVYFYLYSYWFPPPPLTSIYLPPNSQLGWSKNFPNPSISIFAAHREQNTNIYWNIFYVFLITSTSERLNVLIHVVKVVINLLNLKLSLLIFWWRFDMLYCLKHWLYNLSIKHFLNIDK